MKNIIYIISIVILLMSCSKEHDIRTDQADDRSIVLMVKQNAPSTETRSSEDGNSAYNENKIKNLHVFFFSHDATDAQTCIEYEQIDGLSFSGTSGFSMPLSTLTSGFTSGETYDVYTIANLPSNVTIPNPITLGGIKSLNSITPISSTSLQSSFVMDGMSSAVLNPTNLTEVINIDMPLKRAMSKIRVKFVIDTNSDVANATFAHVSLRKYAEIGSLLDENPHTLAQSDYSNSLYLTATPSNTFTFYCHENNWGSTSENETYLIANLPHASQPSNYYRIPINKYVNSVETGRVKRNMIYDVVVYIDQNGSKNESGKTVITSNYTITDWTTKDIILETINQHYLNISEDNIVMPNTSTVELDYVSDLPIAITNITATCVEYNSSGNTSTVTYDSGDPEFPEFIINTQTGTITINSDIPINYVPKYITFTVTNNQGLSLNASIVHYPTRYVTARLSTGNVKPQWYQGGRNLNLFTVNTLVPSTDGSYVLGDPTGGLGYTDATAAGNRVVSPQFIVASQYGIYPSVTYSDAQRRCYEYGEDIYRSGWRLPTKAEMEIINKIQDDPNSAVKALLAGSAYWSAFKYDYYNFNDDRWINSSQTGRAYVRAVYDIYKYEE